jgi:hypothetical protein
MIGALMREHKFHHILVFTRLNVDHFDKLEIKREENRPFNPQILIATSGAANAGIDDPEVYCVARVDFLSSILDVEQEKGCTRCRTHANADSD